MSILRAEGLVKRFSRRTVVDGVTLEVANGEIIGLLGPNGAGKTTTFRMICGMTRPDRGRVSINGEDVTTWPMYVRANKGGMGYLPQQSSVFGKLSVEDNLRGIMQLLGMNRKQQRARTEELLEQFKITHIRRTEAGRVSGGERRRLEIARCLISNPKIIMLDEPFAGIDPVTVQNIQVIIRELAGLGISILITDHAAREILQITDRTYVVSEGRILCQGTTEQIIEHDEVKRKYLGEIDVASIGRRRRDPPKTADTDSRPHSIETSSHLYTSARAASEMRLTEIDP
jgi:lipopolysaccharide export system ATP-binding protein